MICIAKVDVFDCPPTDRCPHVTTTAQYNMKDLT